MDVGALAEDIVATWATNGGFTVNRPQRDRHGWDQILEIDMPRPAGPDDPLGLPTMAVSCRIQIKGTRSARRAVRISLSNWQRAIQDPLPWFVLVVRFSSQHDKLLEAALMHIGKEQIEGAVRRVFSMDEAAKRRLHRKTLAITWDVQALLADPFHDALRKRIQQSIEGNLQEYSVAKKGWYDKAGLSDPPLVKVNFKIGSPSPDELYRKLARAAIGLGDGLEISEFQMLRERFGVDQAYPNVPVSSGTAKLLVGESDADQGWDLILLDKHGSRAATLPVSIRAAASVFPMLPRQFQLIRVRRLLIDLILDQAQRSCSLTIDSPGRDSPLPLRDFKDSMDFLMHLHAHNNEETLIALERNGERLLVVGLRTPLVFNDEAILLGTSLRTLWSLVCHLGIADEKITATMNQLRDIGIAAETMLAARTNGSTQVDFEATVPRSEIDVTCNVGIIADVHVTLGEHTYIEIVAAVGRPEVIAEANETLRIRVNSNALRSMGRRRYRKDELERYSFDDAAASAEQDLKATGIAHVVIAPWNTITI